MREYRIQCEDDPWPAGQRPIGSAHPPAPVTFTRRDLQRACPLTCNGTAIDVQSSTVARSHPTELATERPIMHEVCTNPWPWAREVRAVGAAMTGGPAQRDPRRPRFRPRHHRLLPGARDRP